jgi:hypothetical protein
MIEVHLVEEFYCAMERLEDTAQLDTTKGIRRESGAPLSFGRRFCVSPGGLGKRQI